MNEFSFHPELFEHRSLALEMLTGHGYQWLEHFGSVDLLHDTFGLEVCGIVQQADAKVILRLLEDLFPDWPHSSLSYQDRDRDKGWKVIICRRTRKTRQRQAA